MGKKKAFNIPKRALNIWRVVRPHPTHLPRYATGMCHIFPCFREKRAFPTRDAPRDKLASTKQKSGLPLYAQKFAGKIGSN